MILKIQYIKTCVIQIKQVLKKIIISAVLQTKNDVKI